MRVAPASIVVLATVRPRNFVAMPLLNPDELRYTSAFTSTPYGRFELHDGLSYLTPV